MSPDVAIDAPPVSYEEFLAWPETTALVEVVEGRVIVSASPVGPHQFAAGEVFAALRAAAPPELVALCPAADWVLMRAPLLVRQPDVALVTRGQARAARLESPPVVAVEVLSRESRERDLVIKRREYAEAGLAWYWLVDFALPQVLVLRNDGGVFVEHASARGDERLVIAEPIAVGLVPSDLAV